MALLLQSGLIFIAFLNLVIGTWVLLKNQKSIVNQAFFVFILGICSWILGVILLYLTRDFRFDTLALEGGLLTFFGMSLFAKVFPSGTKPPSSFFLFFIPLGIAAMAAPFHVFIEGIRIDAQGLVQPENGPLFPLYGIVGLGYFVIAPTYFFIQNYSISGAKARMQMNYLGTGILFFIICSLSFDVLLPSLGIYQLNVLGPAASLVLVLATSYAIIRHQLMDIRVVLQRGLIYSILLTLLILMYLCLLYLSESFFDAYEEITTPIFAGILMLFAIVTAPSIEKYFRRITDAYFFKEVYNHAKALEELSSILNVNMRFTEMAASLLTKLDAVFRPECIEFIHTHSGQILKLHRLKFAKEGTDIPSDALTQIPIVTRKRTIGTFNLSRKKSGDPYSEQDFRLFRTFAGQAAVAFEKAELYQKLQNYSHSLEEKVRERTKDLMQIQEHQRQFFDDISHAIQTPLTILKSGVELLKTNAPSEEIRVLDSMEHGVDDLSQLTREILQLARIESVTIEKEGAIICLSKLIENIIEYVEIICRENSITIHSRIEPNIWIHANERQISEVLTNLLSNSIHYTSECEVREITISLTSKNSTADITIRDTGIGISDARLPYIFDRFYRATDSENAGKTGYGLGLAIVKRIIENHHGSIRAESILGTSTTMTISLQTQLPQL